VRASLPYWLRRRLVPVRDRLIQRIIAERYERVYRHIDPNELTSHDTELSEEVLSRELQERDSRSDGLFLGFYSLHGGWMALERYGFLQMLRDKGFEDVVLDVDTSEPPSHTMRIYYGGRRDPDHLLIEIVLQFRTLTLPARRRREYRMLSIEWLVMQDPRREFPRDRPSLPDQEHPGLGLFRWLAELLRLIAVRLECDGLMNRPAHFHNAFLYGKEMKFVDPRDEGLLRALERDVLGDLSLHEATRLIDDGRVVDDAGTVVRWQGRPQVLPINLQLQRYFHGVDYVRSYQRELHRTRYHIAAA